MFLSWIVYQMHTERFGARLMLFSRCVSSWLMYCLTTNSMHTKYAMSILCSTYLFVFGKCHSIVNKNFLHGPKALFCSSCMYVTSIKSLIWIGFVLGLFHRSIHFHTGRMCDTTWQYWTDWECATTCTSIVQSLPFTFLYQHEFEIRQITNRTNLFDRRKTEFYHNECESVELLRLGRVNVFAILITSRWCRWSIQTMCFADKA